MDKSQIDLELAQAKAKAEELQRQKLELEKAEHVKALMGSPFILELVEIKKNVLHREREALRKDLHNWVNGELEKTEAAYVEAVRNRMQQPKNEFVTEEGLAKIVGESWGQPKQKKELEGVV